MDAYKFAPGIVAGSYIFPTDLGWLYTVSFINKSNLFIEGSLLYNSQLSFEFQFERSPIDEHTKKGFDKCVANTLSKVFLLHASSHGYLPIYIFICDITDGKEAARARLFSTWYESIETADWQLINYELTDPDDNNRVYYTGIVLNENHPYFNDLLIEFEVYFKNNSMSKWITRN